MLLNKSHSLTKLIVWSVQEMVQHTLSEVQTMCWIVRGRSLVEVVICKSVIYRQFEGRPFQFTPALPLPSFNHLDTIHHSPRLSILPDPCLLGRKEERKVTRCGFVYSHVVLSELFTLSLSKTCQQSQCPFIQALWWFSARQGLPRLILSDTAEMFKATLKPIKTINDYWEVKDYQSNFHVEYLGIQPQEGTLVGWSVLNNG